jgi:hypothetical protein
MTHNQFFFSYVLTERMDKGEWQRSHGPRSGSCMVLGGWGDGPECAPSSGSAKRDGDRGKISSVPWTHGPYENCTPVPYTPLPVGLVLFFVAYLPHTVPGGPLREGPRGRRANIGEPLLAVVPQLEVLLLVEIKTRLLCWQLL